MSAITRLTTLAALLSATAGLRAHAEPLRDHGAKACGADAPDHHQAVARRSYLHAIRMKDHATRHHRR